MEMKQNCDDDWSWNAIICDECTMKTRRRINPDVDENFSENEVKLDESTMKRDENSTKIDGNEAETRCTRNLFWKRSKTWRKHDETWRYYNETWPQKCDETWLKQKCNEMHWIRNEIWRRMNLELMIGKQSCDPKSRFRSICRDSKESHEPRKCRLTCRIARTSPWPMKLIQRKINTLTGIFDRTSSVDILLASEDLFRRFMWTSRYRRLFTKSSLFGQSLPHGGVVARKVRWWRAISSDPVPLATTS